MCVFNKLLKHIQTNKNTKINDIIKTKQDLYGIEEFYNNYFYHLTVLVLYCKEK